MGLLSRNNFCQLEGAWQAMHKHPVIITILTRDSQFLRYFNPISVAH